MPKDVVISREDRIYATPVIDHFDQGQDSHFKKFSLDIHKEEELNAEEAIRMIQGDLYPRMRRLLAEYGCAQFGCRDLNKKLKALPNFSIDPAPDASIPHQDVPKIPCREGFGGKVTDLQKKLHRTVNVLICPPHAVRRNPTIVSGRTGVIRALIALQDSVFFQEVNPFAKHMFQRLRERLASGTEYEDGGLPWVVHKLCKRLRHTGLPIASHIVRLLREEEGLYEHTWLMKSGSTKVLMIDNRHALHWRGRALTSVPREKTRGQLRYLLKENFTC